MCGLRWAAGWLVGLAARPLIREFRSVMLESCDGPAAAAAVARVIDAEAHLYT